MSHYLELTLQRLICGLQFQRLLCCTLLLRARCVQLPVQLLHLAAQPASMAMG